MLKNYFKIALRNILKYKIFSFINIFGLALGLAACILVGLFIWQELNYDSYHLNCENIYRVSMKITGPPVSTKILHLAQTPAIVATNLKQNFPEIDKSSRIYFSNDNLITYKDKRILEDEVIFADEDFFDIFNYKILQGNPNKFLREKNTIIITQKTADKYFGKENPIGKIINYNNKLDLKIEGVIENVPINSHFTFSMVATYETLVDLPVRNYLNQWGATFGSYTYIMLNNRTNVTEFENKISHFLTTKMDTSDQSKHTVILQPLKSIHLHSNLEDEITPNSSIKYLLILSSIALFILILAVINFVNLTTARALKRAREIGVRKVFGASRLELSRQFLGESVLITLIALAFALVMIELFIPSFSQLIGKTLIYNCFGSAYILFVIVASTIIIGIFAGLYPAFVLTHYQPALIMKGEAKQGKSGTAILRKCLILFQFSISIILIIFTILINQQVNFMRSFDMGFDKDLVVILKTPERMSYNSETVKSEINAIPGVIESSVSLGAPLQGSGFGTNLIEKDDKEMRVKVKMIDFNYLDFYNIPLLAGRKFSELIDSDFRTVTVVNESTVKSLGFSSNEEAIGHAYTISLSDGEKPFKPKIVGVVKDFNFESLHENVSPLLFMNWTYLFKEVSIKINPKNIPETLKEVKHVWEKFYPAHPFAYSFLDDDIDKMYNAEERSFRVVSFFSVLAIIIACMGLLGLTIYTSEQRRKEIGIRKILGASISNIMKNLSLEFIKLVLIANAIAWPVSYLLINKWLASFPYKVNINVSIFVIAGMIALFISFITIGYTVFRISFSNPVTSIKYE